MNTAACLYLTAFLLLFNSGAAAQEPAPVPQDPPDTPAQREVSVKLLIPNILEDQKRMWLFPLKAVHSKAFLPALGVVGATTALVYADRYDTAWFQRTKFFGRFDQVFGSDKTEIGTAIVPALFFAVGLARKDSYTTQTGLLAAEALADAEVIQYATKAVSRRIRPEGVPRGGDFEDTWFANTTGGSGFVSGHTIAAFAIATVVARRYPNHRLVRYAAYGVAGLIGFSRVSLGKHFPSDVFAGAALGYSISRFAVLRP